MYLARMGFEHVLNLSGGIDAWSETPIRQPRATNRMPNAQ